MTRIEIAQADALTWCRALESESVDCWWSSPPYNLEDPFRSGGNQSGTKRPRFTYDGEGRGDGLLRDEAEYQDEQAAVLNEWYRTLRPDGVAFYNHKVRIKGGEAISPLRWIWRTPFVLLQELVWDRAGTPQVDDCRFLPVSERIYVLTKRPFIKLSNRHRTADVVRVPRSPANRAQSGHPCPTHPAVVRACLSVLTKPEGRPVLVADPYMGSGTTALVAYELGMDCIGCDRSETYVSLARGRVLHADLMRQPPLAGVA